MSGRDAVPGCGIGVNVSEDIKITFASVCSGIEAASVAWEPLGWRARWFSEIESFPCCVLKHHWPTTPNLGDMTKIPNMVRYMDRAPDVFTGGTPCQAFSVAGNRNSLDDDRGNLTLTFVEIANALDKKREELGQEPTIIMWENVPGVLNTKDNAFGCFLAGLAGNEDPLEPCERPEQGPTSSKFTSVQKKQWGIDKKTGNLFPKWPSVGVVVGPQRAIAWRVLDAQYFGVAQRRRRVFVVASAREGFDPAEILFEFEGMRRDTPPSRETGEEVTGTIGARTSSGGGFSTDFEVAGGLQAVSAYGQRGQFGGLEEVEVSDTLRATGADCGGGSEALAVYGGNNTAGPIEVSPALNANRGCHNPGDFEAGALCVTGDKTHTLTGEGHDASEDGTGRGTPVVATLDANYGRLQGCSGQDANHGHSHLVPVQNLISFPAEMSGTPAAQAVNISPALSVTHTIAFAQNSRDELRLEGGDSQVVGALKTGGGKPGQPYPAIADIDSMRVRRLTPRECERLQGFPDDHTLVPIKPVPAHNQEKQRQRMLNGDTNFSEIDGVIYVMSKDGPRYKAIGNSWAAPCARWIGQRIDNWLRRATA